MLEIKNLKSNIINKEILKGINLNVKKGEIIGIMGPNGSGKSTLSNILMGNKLYNTSGKIIFNNEEISNLTPDKRSKKGLFLSFQHPLAIPGLTINQFLKTMLKSQFGKIPLRELKKKIIDALELLKMDESILKRYVNDGFSGGEKKKFEMLQMILLKPKLSILDETDSGLDIDALNIVAKAVNKIKNKNNSFIIITHYSRILNLIKPNKIFILINGKIVYKGVKTLVNKLEKEGYDWIKKKIE